MTEGQILVDLILKKEFDKINSIKWKIKCLQFDVYIGSGRAFHSNADSSIYINFDTNLDGLTFPDSLEHIYFNDEFNQSLDNVKFPKNLKVLLFGSKFNQNIDKMHIPESLEQLQFGDNFDQLIGNITFPNYLKKISFGKNFSHSLANAKFPNDIQLILYSIESSDILPPNLENLLVGYINKPLLNLSIGLKTLIFYCDPDNNLKKSKIPFGCKVYKIKESNEKEEILID